MNLVYIALAAFAGALVSAILGWLETNEPFAARKFLGSVLRAISAAAIFAATYSFKDGPTPLDFLLAFLGGSGVDVLGNRLAGSIKKTPSP